MYTNMHGKYNTKHVLDNAIVTKNGGTLTELSNPSVAPMFCVVSAADVMPDVVKIP